MKYTSSFLQNSDSASKLLAESGYSTNQLVSAVQGLGELCVLGLTISHLVENHSKGDLLPPRFEVELQISPMKLQRVGEIDLLKPLEDHNVLISLGKNKYRVMTSSMLNRMFALSAQTGTDSIRSGFSGVGDQSPLDNALNLVEWEIIEVVHNHIDIKYLEVNELENQMKPQELLSITSQVSELASEFRNMYGEELPDDVEIVTKLFKDKKFLTPFREYLQLIGQLSDISQREVEKQKNLISRFSTYPRSFVGRKTVPLVGSSWNLRSDFRNHPLIQKFLLLIESNHTKLARLADLYEDFIRDFAEKIKRLPNCVDILSVIEDTKYIYPTIEEIEEVWVKINRSSDALLGQAKFVEIYLASMDTLFNQSK